MSNGTLPINGSAVRELRESRYLSQRELAEIAGVSFMVVQRWERGETTKAFPRSIRALATALEVEPSVLSGAEV